MMPVRVLCLTIAAGLVALTVYGMVTLPGLQPILDSMTPFWGKFVWLDVYAGIALMAAIVFAFERSVAVAAGVLVAMILLGNAATALWVCWRAPELFRRIKGPIA